MTVAELTDCLEQNPVIAAVGEDKWEEALASPAQVLFHLSAELTTVKERIRIASVLPADKIRKGEYKVPELKRLTAKTSSGIPEGFTALADTDLPF